MCFPLFWFRSIDFRMGFLGVADPSFLGVGFLVGLWSLNKIHEYSKYWRPMIRQRCKSLLLPWIVFSLGCFSISGCSAIGPYFMRFCEKTIQCEKRQERCYGLHHDLQRMKTYSLIPLQQYWIWKNFSIFGIKSFCLWQLYGWFIYPLIFITLEINSRLFLWFWGQHHNDFSPYVSWDGFF